MSRGSSRSDLNWFIIAIRLCNAIPADPMRYKLLQINKRLTPGDDKIPDSLKNTHRPGPACGQKEKATSV